MPDFEGWRYTTKNTLHAAAHLNRLWPRTDEDDAFLAAAPRKGSILTHESVPCTQQRSQVACIRTPLYLEILPLGVARELVYHSNT